MKKLIIIILLVLALLLVLAGIAAALFFPIVGREVGFSRSLVYATAEENKTLNVKGPLTLKVQDDAGKVNIVGGDGQNVTVTIVKTGAATTQAAAEKDLKSLKYQIQQNGNAITLTYKLDNLNIQDVDTIDFTVNVPSETTVDIDARLGDVSVSGITGNATIVNDFGEVTAQKIEGRLSVDTQSGQVEAVSINAGSENIELASGFGKISLEKASGKDLKLNSKSGALETNDVRASGDIEMSTDFGGVDFHGGSANLLSVETQSGKVTLSKLNLHGTVTARSGFGEIDLEQVSADSYDLQTNSGSITADGVTGKVKAHSDFGAVTIKNADHATVDLSTKSGEVDFEGSLGDGAHSLHSEFGAINIIIPADSALNVDLKTNFGSIKSEIPITVTLSGETEKSHEVGKMNKGGSQLTVETESGNISIQAGQ